MIAARRVLTATCMTLSGVALLATVVAAQTSTTERTQQGAATVTTEQMRGEVVKVEGNTVVVKMSSGELRTFSDIPETRKAMVDGKEVGVRELQPGTRLTATITKTATPVVYRTTTVGTGKVFFVSPPNVILTLPSGENKQYKVKDDYKFMVNGSPATVFDLRQGMVVSAEKIVEEPKVEIATNSQVVGQAARAAQAAGTSAAAAPAATTARSGQGTNAGAAPKASAPLNSKAAGNATGHTAAGGSSPALPKTGSQVPLVGLLGLLFLGASLTVRMVRRA